MANEFPVNTTTTGDQDQPGVAGLQGTQFITVWRDTSTQDIRGRLFGVNGVASSPEFNIALPQAAGTKRQLPAVIETRFGFAVAWIEQLPGAAPQLKVRAFDADTLSGEETQASSAEVEPLVRPAMARLADGGFVVVWADKRREERIRAQRYGLDTMKSGAEFGANTIPELHRFPMAAGQPNGNFVIGWRARSAAPLLAHFQMFNPSGGPIGAEQTTTLDVTETAMAQLDTGRFVIAHIRQPFDGETGFETTFPQASLFEANGTPTNLRFVATTLQRIQSSSLAIAPLSGGRFLLAWVADKHRQPRRRLECRGKSLFERGCARERGPGQHPDRRKPLQPRGCDHLGTRDLGGRRGRRPRHIGARDPGTGAADPGRRVLTARDIAAG